MPDELTPDGTQPTWLAEVAQGLDPRTRAVLDADGVLVSVPDEALSVMSAAVQEMLEEAPRRGGVAPVLGAGVLAEFRKLAREAKDATAVPVEGSHIDAKR